MLLRLSKERVSTSIIYVNQSQLNKLKKRNFALIYFVLFNTISSFLVANKTSQKYAYSLALSPLGLRGNIHCNMSLINRPVSTAIVTETIEVVHGWLRYTMSQQRSNEWHPMLLINGALHKIEYSRQEASLAHESKS